MQSSSPPAPTAAPALARRLNLSLLVLYGLGTTIGAGIYALMGEVAARAGMAAPLSFLLGFCYPFGARQVERLDERAVAWMWGTNGALGVLASVVAIAISIWIGIETNLFIAAGCYLVLPVLATVLGRYARAEDQRGRKTGR